MDHDRTDPVHTRWIGLPAEGGTMDAYLALPPAGHGPGLLLLQEIFGVNDHIQGVAEQFALAGFVVLAPDLFWRQQPHVELGYEGAERARALTLMQAMQPAATLADLQASVAALRARPEVGARRVGALGYCMGGRLAWLAASRCGVDAAVAYYGGGIQNQLELAATITGPVQLHYGERDDHIPPDAVESVRAVLAGKPAEVHVYPGAQHGFNCWARASYDAASAALALGRSQAFLAGALFAAR